MTETDVTSKPLNEVKALLVGGGGAGKTSLAKQLRGLKFNTNEPQTHGIDINPWVVTTDSTEIIVHLWDFGGQEIMHATHQFFLSRRSLYVLVLDGRRDEKIEYWLKLIETFGGDSPVMVVLNKIDQNPGFDVNRRFLLEKYPHIKGFFRVSCATKVGIEEFLRAFQQEVAQMEMMQTTWPPSWFRVKTRIEYMKKHYISYKEYEKICDTAGVADEYSRDTLLDFLHDLGVVLHFRELELENTQVLEPAWATSAVYKIINSPQLAENKGILSTTLLPQLLKGQRKEDFYYPKDKFPYIIQLMRKFEICYFMNKNTVLVPDLLEVQEPDFDFDYKDSLRFVLDYDFLPRSVMPRFIVKMHEDIEGSLRWRTGVILKNDIFDSRALIKSDQMDEKIFIYVSGNQKRDFFSVIRHAFQVINQSFEKLRVDEMVPLPGDEQELVRYKDLIGFELARKDEMFIGSLGREYSVSQLLNGINRPEDRVFEQRKFFSKKDLLAGAGKRRFSSYGPINTKRHYYVPRDDLISSAYQNLVGTPHEGGHYITVWAPRQTGKTWVMQELVDIIKQDPTDYSVGIFSMERGKKAKNSKTILEIFTGKLSEVFQVKFPTIKEFREIPSLFTKDYFSEPVILIIDEFDALQEEFINDFAAVFRDMFISRSNEKKKSSREKSCLLHGLTLVGVRSVLGIENVTGSPFNVQRSVHIPNLTYEEVKEMFHWYEQDSGRKIDGEVIDKLFYETNGQPGLTCWFGELLSEGFEGYAVDTSKPVTKRDFEIVYAAATYALPNNNILNLISKAKQEPEKSMVLKMFQTDEKIEFRFDNKAMNSLYMNGIADREVVEYTRHYLKFSCPFVQKRLFNYFSDELFNEMGTLVEPFAKIDHVVTPASIDIRELMKLYETYLEKNKSWLFKDAPRRSDLKLFEAVYHFNLFAYLKEFLRSKDGNVLPEFPTGNGQIDLFITYKDKVYGLELKSFTDRSGYEKDLKQAAGYGEKLGLSEISLVIFVESIDDKNRRTYGKDYKDSSGVTVKPIFVCTGVL